MKKIDIQVEKVLTGELEKLLKELPDMKVQDTKRISILNQIQIITRVLKQFGKTTATATKKESPSPLEQFMKKNKNETISKKEPQRSKYSRV